MNFRKRNLLWYYFVELSRRRSSISINRKVQIKNRTLMVISVNKFQWSTKTYYRGQQSLIFFFFSFLKETISRFLSTSVEILVHCKPISPPSPSKTRRLNSSVTINYTVSRPRNYAVIPRVSCPSSQRGVFSQTSRAFRGSPGRKRERHEPNRHGFISEVRPRI